MKKRDKLVKIIFGIRICLWVVALGLTVHWIYWSFKLYAMGILDVYDYAKHFRPLFYQDLIITFIVICLSFLLRSISDRIKGKIKHSEE